MDSHFGVRHHFATPVNLAEDTLVTLQEARLQCSTDLVEEDDDLLRKLQAATEDAEVYTARKFLTQNWTIFWPRWPNSNSGFFRIPFGKLQNIHSFDYRTGDGTIIPLNLGTDFLFDENIEPARIVLAKGSSWPGGDLYPTSPIKAEITCGYGAPDTVPASIKEAVLLHLAHMYAHREAVVVGDRSSVDSRELAMGSKHLLNKYKLWSSF